MLKKLLTLLALLGTGAAHAADPHAAQRCLSQLQTDQSRIQRDFVRERPPASDKAAYDRWASSFHAALNAAGKAAEECERKARPALTPERRTTLDTCISQVAGKSQDIDRRYAGRTLSREEQAKMREEYQALHDQRIACDLASRR